MQSSVSEGTVIDDETVMLSSNRTEDSSCNDVKDIAAEPTEGNVDVYVTIVLMMMMAIAVMYFGPGDTLTDTAATITATTIVNTTTDSNISVSLFGWTTAHTIGFTEHPLLLSLHHHLATISVVCLVCIYCCQLVVSRCTENQTHAKLAKLANMVDLVYDMVMKLQADLAHKDEETRKLQDADMARKNEEKLKDEETRDMIEKLQAQAQREKDMVLAKAQREKDKALADAHADMARKNEEIRGMVMKLVWRSGRGPC